MSSTVNIDSFLICLEKLFKENANPEIARKQSDYMKNHFHFLGIQKPLRKSLLQSTLNELSIQNESIFVNILNQLWHKEQREFHYTACDIAEKYLILASSQTIPFFEKMVRTKSWWDTVDKIASNLLGPTILRYPKSKLIMDDWIRDSNIWIRRSALLFQLRYKEKTDEEVLFKYCRQTMHEKEFFIQKAIGWALREYSKTSPRSVINFIDKYRSKLSSLSTREGSKIILKGQ